LTAFGADPADAPVILIVEDDAVIREATAMTLERYGFQVRTATAYAALIYREASQRVVERTYRELTNFGTRYARPETRPNGDEVTYYRESLRLYLMLTTPRAPEDPQLSDANQRAWFNAQIAQAWNAVYPTTVVAQVAARTRIVELYALVLAADQRLGYPRDLQLVTRIRTILARAPQ
jgi:CheY-like chemotaxis protein